MTTATPDSLQPEAPRRGTLNLRLPDDERNLLDSAAAALGVTCTSFVRRAIRRAAEDALLERAVISVSPEAYAAFIARLDAPPQPNARLIKAMQAASPWSPS